MRRITNREDASTVEELNTFITIIIMDLFNCVVFCGWRGYASEARQAASTPGKERVCLTVENVKLVPNGGGGRRRSQFIYRPVD